MKEKEKMSPNEYEASDSKKSTSNSKVRQDKKKVEINSYVPELGTTIVSIHVDDAETARKINCELKQNKNKIKKIVLVCESGEKIDIDLKSNPYSTRLMRRRNTTTYRQAMMRKRLANYKGQTIKKLVGVRYKKSVRHSVNIRRKYDETE